MVVRERRYLLAVRELNAARGGVVHRETLSEQDYLVYLVPVGPAGDLHRVLAGCCKLDGNLRLDAVDTGRALVLEVAVRGIAEDLDEGSVAVACTLGSEPRGVGEVEPAVVAVVARDVGGLAHQPLERVGSGGGDVDEGGDDVAVLGVRVDPLRGQALPDDVLPAACGRVINHLPGARDDEVFGLDDHGHAVVDTVQHHHEQRNRSENPDGVKVGESVSDGGVRGAIHQETKAFSHQAMDLL